MATVTRLRAHGQLADALTKPGRDTPLQQTIRTGAYAVRLATTDYLTKRSSAAPEQDGVIENYKNDDSNVTTKGHPASDVDDDHNTDDDADGAGTGEQE